MQGETINIFYQRRQNGWRKNFIYTLKVLPNRMKQVTKCHALQVKLVVENWRLKAAAKSATAENQKSNEIPFFHCCTVHIGSITILLFQPMHNLHTL